MHNIFKKTAIAGAMCLAAGAALAQGYPEKPIEVIVGYSAGGGTDVMARTAAPFIEKYLGEGASVVVKNVPGASGQIGVTDSLLALVQNDDQLATVIGHEIGHVVANHAAERASSQAATSIGLAAVGGAAGRYGDAVNAYGGLAAQYGLLMPYSRRDELEADRLGVDYMQAAGFRPSQAVALWRLMAAQRQASIPQFASTHPSDATRIDLLQQYIAGKGWS